MGTCPKVLVLNADAVCAADNEGMEAPGQAPDAKATKVDKYVSFIIIKIKCS